MDPVILIDADACPVKDECYKVAARHGLKVFLVANRLSVHYAPEHLSAKDFEFDRGFGA